MYEDHGGKTTTCAASKQIYCRRLDQMMTTSTNETQTPHATRTSSVTTKATTTSNATTTTDVTTFVWVRDGPRFVRSIFTCKEMFLSAWDKRTRADMDSGESPMSRFVQKVCEVFNNDDVSLSPLPSTDVTGEGDGSATNRDIIAALAYERKTKLTIEKLRSSSHCLPFSKVEVS